MITDLTIRQIYIETQSLYESLENLNPELYELTRAEEYQFRKLKERCYIVIGKIESAMPEFQGDEKDANTL